jgi:type I restriction enzyme S subunit
MNQIPEGWRVIKFDDFTTLQRGKDLTKDSFKSGIVPVAGSNGVIGYHNDSCVEAPGVTVGRSGSCGKVNFYDVDFWAHNTSLYVRDFHGNDVRFAALFLEFLDLGRFRTGASVPTLDRNSFRELPVDVPDVHEQRRIARVLTTVQTAIEQQARLIALTRELKRALMKKLFTEGLRGEKQKETEIGLVPESWEIVKLQDVCQLIVDCPHTTPSFQPSGVRVARNFNIRDGRFVFEHAFFTTEDEYRRRIKRAEPRPGDILFSREAPVGEACLIPRDMKLSLGQRTMLVRTNPAKLDAAFMVYSFYSPNVSQRMLSMASGLTVAHLNVADVRSLAVPIPATSEQIEIGHQLTAVDERIEIIHAKKNLLEELFRTLLHQLMTGQTRVKEIDLPRL